MAIELPQDERVVSARRVGAVRRVRGCATRLAACARKDAALVAELIVWRVSLPVLKRVLRISTLARFMWSAPAAGNAGGSRAGKIASIRYCSRTGGRLLVSSNCLERSLMLYRLFSRAGVAPTLVIGARPEPSALAAHAWIEIDAEPLDEPNVEQYARLVAFGPEGRRRGPVALESVA